MKAALGIRNMNTKEINQLFDAFLSLETRDECKQFMSDLCTPKEIRDFADRLEIAKLLKEENLSYRDIAKKINTSTTTVSRVARFLTQEPHQGYNLILDRIKN